MKTTFFIGILYTLSFQVFAIEDTTDNKQQIFDKKTALAFSKNPKVFLNKNGQEIINANEGLGNVILSRVDKNGKLETYCTSNQENAIRFLDGEDIASIEGKLK